MAKKLDVGLLCVTKLLETLLTNQLNVLKGSSWLKQKIIYWQLNAVQIFESVEYCTSTLMNALKYTEVE